MAAADFLRAQAEEFWRFSTGPLSHSSLDSSGSLSILGGLFQPFPQPLDIQLGTFNFFLLRSFSEDLLDRTHGFLQCNPMSSWIISSSLAPTNSESPVIVM